MFEDEIKKYKDGILDKINDLYDTYFFTNKTNITSTS